ncbi:hypothetical protein BCR33DRAFT_297700 [Rhizoclosmatium globosum]|uniref:Zn(2)-C6 fungal-type domain-containing protein n=1 Tax=Rhizoclosmatium globosum TaxID=329046 RepID=A0A1Y2C6P5_9FUNG|nr:hypothetical protein BCR33DRAFT_297700 [Rhizoclosmatium globosum]|eukprot:ORY42547.1 hypothetical protein BCR33DRAFT_297700 [Rhizoclosmatium globosum]
MLTPHIRTRSCENCRTLRKQCDKGLPSCTRCQQRGILCRYAVAVAGGNLTQDMQPFNGLELQEQLALVQRGKRPTPCLECKSLRKRCDTARPSCERCLGRNVICEYPTRRFLSAPPPAVEPPPLLQHSARIPRQYSYDMSISLIDDPHEFVRSQSMEPEFPWMRSLPTSMSVMEQILSHFRFNAYDQLPPSLASPLSPVDSNEEFTIVADYLKRSLSHSRSSFTIIFPLTALASFFADPPAIR